MNPSFRNTVGNCCELMIDQQQLEGKKGKARWRIIYMHIYGAIQLSHSDCIKALLTLNGQPDILSGKLGKAIAKKIGKGTPTGVESESSYPANIFQTLLDFGLSAKDFVENIPHFYCAEKDRTIHPIEIVMRHQTPQAVAVLLQIAHGNTTEEDAKQLHQQAVCRAIESANTELVRKLVATGTSKQLLVELIRQNRRKVFITDIQARNLTDAVNMTNKRIDWSSGGQISYSLRMFRWNFP